ncbi:MULTISPECIES: hypothetical protein [unclassified Streptomyces]|uniref:hypothetical protein n=1 Tax=unclassified Streptomyces TaxID=2593676 RepID=UPI000DD5DCCB|nr:MULTISPECIES: hypothetical protein [unclassified Streptomyces]QZZ26558.1 hypothetical protein A7X85_10080 [Streptomyces sp. ST1015]
MAEFTCETVVRTVRRWIIPAAEPRGAAAAEVGKAWAAAERAYRDHHGLRDEEGLHDDALRFHAYDDRIVIEFETEAEES